MNNQQNDPLRNTVLANAIRAIGIGKHGSKPLPVEWIADCKTDFISPTVNHAQAGAFFGALSVKSKHNADELELLDFCNEKITDGITIFHLKSYQNILIPVELTALANKLLARENLSIEEAIMLGNYIFSVDKSFDFIRGISASVMRVRYETDEELAGFYEVLKNNYSKEINAFSFNPDQLKIQLAEPFDGADHSPIITPLLAKYLAINNYLPIIITGKNPGPKFNLNLFDIINNLNVENNTSSNFDLGSFSKIINCSLLSNSWDYWLNIRFATIKRPFLSTIEKIFNPLKADVLISSVYHITYQEKMVSLSFMAGFKGAIVMKRGLEGSLTPNTSKGCGILCAVKKDDGTIIKTIFDMSHPDMQEYISDEEIAIENLTLEENRNWIINYNTNNKSENAVFINYVKAAEKLYGLGLNWLKENW